MATAAFTTMARDVLTARMSPVFDMVQENARQVRRAVVRGRHTAEDLVAGAALQVRRHPLGAVTAAICTGLAAGALVGFFVGRNGRTRT